MNVVKILLTLAGALVGRTVGMDGDSRSLKSCLGKWGL